MVLIQQVSTSSSWRAASRACAARMLLHRPAAFGQGQLCVDAGGHDPRCVAAAVPAVMRDRGRHLRVVVEVDRGVRTGRLPVGAEAGLRCSAAG